VCETAAASFVPLGETGSRSMAMERTGSDSAAAAARASAASSRRGGYHYEARARPASARLVFQFYHV
jgi:hypothetical protein